jgi:hypothetical protein
MSYMYTFAFEQTSFWEQRTNSSGAISNADVSYLTCLPIFRTERTMDAAELTKHKERVLVLCWPDEAGEGPFAKLVWSIIL